MFSGNKIVFACSWKPEPIETGNVLHYYGSAVINGVIKQNALVGPHFDTIYELSNIFKFDIELKQDISLGDFHTGVLSGDLDIAMGFANFFSSYQVFQIGEYGYEMDAELYLACTPPVPQVQYMVPFTVTAKTMLPLCSFMQCLNI